MDLSVILVFPTLSYVRKKDFALPPLGISYLAAHLKRERPEVSVHLVDLEVKDWNFDRCVSHILSYDPDIVGISVMTPFLMVSLELIRGIKQREPRVKTLLGGPHITATGAEIYSMDIPVKPDYLVFGEGEDTLVDIVDNINDESSVIKGALRQLKGGEVVGRPQGRGHIRDLDSLPILDFGMLNVSDYTVVQSKRRNSLSLMASRGCPYNCSFCDVSITQGKRLRLRSPEHIIEEIKLNFDKYGITNYYFKDSTFTIKRDWVIRICEIMQQNNLRVTWSCNTRAGLVDDELLNIMRKAGCVLMAFGFESADDEVLRAMNKMTSHKMYYDAVEKCRKNGIEVYGFFMVGNFEEDIHKARKTLNFALHEDLAWASFSPVAAYPGTELYDRAIKSGVLKDPKWYTGKKGESFFSLVIGVGGLEHPEFPIDQQIKFIKAANRRFYMRFKWLRKMLPFFLDVNYVLKVLPFSLKFLRFVSR
jgi:radical SAM superfamily enzyme YgiQ (UPF0313 family)